MHERERGGKYVAPSATAMNSFVAFRMDEGDPLINLDREDWNIYVVEGVRLFCSPTWDNQADSYLLGSRKSTHSPSRQRRSLSIPAW